MSLADLDTCIAHYRFDGSGWDGANGRLTDLGAHGFHLAIGGARSTPLYRDLGGEQHMEFDGSWWFEGRNAILGGGSIILLSAFDVTGADGKLLFWTTLKTDKSPTGLGPDGSVAGVADADWHVTNNQGHFLEAYGMSLKVGTRTGNPGAPSVSPPQRGAMYLYAAALPGDPALNIAAANGDVPGQAGPYANTKDAVPIGGWMRLGHLKATPGLSAGKYVALKRAWFLRGNAFDHPGFEAARAAELNAWGIA